MQSTERDLRILLGAFLRRRTLSAKDLARHIDCDARTAEGYRAGRYWPQACHWVGLVATFSRDVTDAVFHPDAATERLAQEVRALEDTLAKKRADLAATTRSASRLAEARDRFQDRSADLNH